MIIISQTTKMWNSSLAWIPPKDVGNYTEGPKTHPQLPRLPTLHGSHFSSVQFSCSVVSDSLWPHEPQHARSPCLSPTLRVHPNPCPLSQWCHPTISSSAIPFSSCPQSFPGSGWVSPSTSVLPMNTQDWSPLGWTGWISLQSKGLNSLLQHHSSKASILRHSAFFIVQLSHPYMILEKPYLWLDGPFLAKKCLCFLRCCLGWS